ncbi:MAG: hypothetical protein AAF639_46020 [Chloroflexota bacterium]
MKIKFESVDIAEMNESLTQHLSNYTSPVDTFFESHVVESNHYRITINGVYAGYTAIHDGSLVTQFHLLDTFKHYGQHVFHRIKKLEKVQRAFAPTCDEFFVSHALDEHQRFEMQAYFFQQRDRSAEVYVPDDFSFRVAKLSEVDLIRQSSGDFFEPIEETVEKGQVYITYKAGACAGFGILIQCKYRPNLADIGMFTNQEFRYQGVGTATIRFLMRECQRNGWQIVAGCWYYNHFSKQTLEKAGLYSQTRLLKISY